MAEDVNKTTAIEIIEKNPIGMLTTQTSSGELRCRPMTVMQVEDDGQLWIITAKDSSPVKEINDGLEVGLSINGSGEWLVLRGEATVIKNDPKAHDLWNEAAQAFFPGGPESDQVVLIRIRPDGGEYWTTPSGLVATAFKWAKARITGEVIDAGNSQALDF